MTKDSNEDTSGGTSLPPVDPNSAYYIHPSDYPRQLHVNETLNDSNYGDWSQEMKNFLFAKNKIGFIDGTIKVPEKGEQILLWKRCDAMIKGWLTTAMEKEIRNSVKYTETAEEMWKDLEERFGKESAPRAYELKRELTLIRQEKASVSAYYTKLRGLWDEIQSISPMPKCTCGLCKCGIGRKLIERKEKEQLYEFLMGLDESFGIVKTQILTTKPTPTLGSAYHMVSEDEMQRSISIGKRSIFEGAAFQAKLQQRPTNQTQQRPAGNTMYQQQGHVRNGEKRRFSSDERCDHCDRPGHTKDGCFKIIGYPEWWQDKKKRDGNRWGDRYEEKRSNPRAAQVNINSSPIPGLTAE